MIDSIAEQAQSMMNDISTTTSERNIIKESTYLDYNTISLKLVSYIQLFEGMNNTPCSSSVGAVTLNPSNEKGDITSCP